MQYQYPPFELGETLDGTDSDGNLINESVLGMIYEFPAQRLGVSGIGGKKGRKTGKSIKAVALRNVSGIKLYGKRLAQTKSDSGGYELMEEVDGYEDEGDSTNVVIIDEFLDSTGVADDDIFWGILEGPVTVKTQDEGNAGNSISIGDGLAAGTATGTTLSTASDNDVGGVKAHSDPNPLELIGVALSARTTDETGEDLLINASIRVL